MPSHWVSVSQHSFRTLGDTREHSISSQKTLFLNNIAVEISNPHFVVFWEAQFHANLGDFPLGTTALIMLYPFL